LDFEIVDHTVWHVRDRAGYELSVVARLKGPHVINVLYKIRMANPKGDCMDYMLTLDGFKELGELLVALHDFCKDPIFTREVQSVEKLKECLTAENITNWAKLSKLQSEKTKGNR
jgi:hypothetical protein